MKNKFTLSVTLALATMIILGFESVSKVNGGNKNKITICHHTGSKSNPIVTITIDASAWPAHLAHGDTLFDVECGCDCEQGIKQ